VTLRLVLFSGKRPSSHFQAARGLTAALRLENVAIFPSSFERRRSSSSAVGVFRGVPQVALLAHRARARRQWTVDETARAMTGLARADSVVSARRDKATAGFRPAAGASGP